MLQIRLKEKIEEVSNVSELLQEKDEALYPDAMEIATRVKSYIDKEYDTQIRK